MKKSYKVLLAFILLIGLGFSICILSFFYPIPVINSAVANTQTVIPWLDYVFAGYGACICLCFIVLLLVILFLPSRSDFLVINKSKGSLLFSRRTVESTVRYSFADMDMINSSRIKIKLGKKVKIYIKISVNDIGGLESLTETVQEKIAASLQSSLGITAKSITIKVTEFSNSAKSEPIPKELE